MFNKNVFTQKDPIADLVAPILEAQAKAKMEELKGNQKVLDKNKNNKLDSQDFKILRGEKKAVKEESETLEEGLLGGGYKMKMKHEGKYRIHAPDGSHVGDVTKEPGAGKWRHHAGGSKWDGTETSPHYKTGISNNVVDAAKKVAQIHKASLNEGWDDMMKAAKERSGPQPSGGAGVKKGRAYGGAAQKSKPEQETDKVKKEEVEKIDEGLMGHIEVKPAKKGGDSETLAKHDVHYKGKKIGHIEVYQHRSGMKYGDVHHATGESTAGHRSMDDAIDSLRQTHAQHLKSMKEEVQIDERSLTPGETSKKERIVKGMKKNLAGFKARYGERAKSVMYATATKAAKKD